jgi:hypothetical protein
VLDYPSCLLYRLCRVEKEAVQVPILGGRNYDIMKSDINNDLSKLNEWAKLWLVDFNPKKTCAVPHLDLRFNGEPVFTMLSI